MGYIRNEYIIITHWDLEELQELHPKLVKIWKENSDQLGNCVSEVMTSPSNEYANILIFPDGSKEGWKESDDGDNARQAICSYLTENDIAYLYLSHDEEDRITTQVVNPIG